MSSDLFSDWKNSDVVKCSLKAKSIPTFLVFMYLLTRCNAMRCDAMRNSSAPLNNHGECDN